MSGSGLQVGPAHSLAAVGLSNCFPQIFGSPGGIFGGVKVPMTPADTPVAAKLSIGPAPVPLLRIQFMPSFATAFGVKKLINPSLKNAMALHCLLFWHCCIQASMLATLTALISKFKNCQFDQYFMKKPFVGSTMGACVGFLVVVVVLLVVVMTISWTQVAAPLGMTPPPIICRC